MNREHQQVKFNDGYIVLSDAISKREQLIKIKNGIQDELRKYENAIGDITRSIELACDHDWEKHTEYTCGEKDTWSLCKICGAVKGGHC